MISRILMTIFAFLLLAAHYSRAENTVLTVVSLLLPILFFMKRRITLIVLQVLLYLGSVVWIHTTVLIVMRRIGGGESWIRVLIILGCVTLFTVITGLLLNSKKMKEKYPS